MASALQQITQVHSILKELMQVLDLSYNFLLSPALYPLSTLPKLRKLNIDFNNVSIILEAGIVETSFPSLERLYAAGNGLSAQSLLSLSKVCEAHAVALLKFQDSQHLYFSLMCFNARKTIVVCLVFSTVLDLISVWTSDRQACCESFDPKIGDAIQ